MYRASLARFRLLRCRSSAQLVEAAAVMDSLLAPPHPDAAGGDQPHPAPARLLLIDNLVRARCMPARHALGTRCVHVVVFWLFACGLLTPPRLRCCDGAGRALLA